MNFDALDISASALYAQRVKMDAISSNIANVNTTRSPDGKIEPYKRKDVIFKAVYNDAINTISEEFNLKRPVTEGVNVLKGGITLNSTEITQGVKVEEIVEDNTPAKKIYDPTHPDADKDGYVNMPNINIVTEMVNMISASKAYEANITTIETAKSMFSAAMRI